MLTLYMMKKAGTSEISAIMHDLDTFSGSVIIYFLVDYEDVRTETREENILYISTQLLKRSRFV